MSYSSCLINIQSPLVIDTSVLINLHACSYGERILSAIPNQIVVAEIVANELNHETSRKNGEQSFLQGLVENNVLELTSLTDDEYEMFGQLISSSPSLDDGEAATIAIAVSRQFFPIVDEKKGRARATSLMSAKEPGWSLDLLRHPSVMSELGESAIEALFFALRDGRMRIPTASAEHVIVLIGIERSRECTCLPGYRERFSDKS